LVSQAPGRIVRFLGERPCAAAGLLCKRDPTDNGIDENAGCAAKVDMTLEYGCMSSEGLKSKKFAVLEFKFAEYSDNRIQRNGTVLAQTFVPLVGMEATLGIAMSSNAVKIYRMDQMPQDSAGNQPVKLYRYPDDGKLLFYRSDLASKRLFALLLIEIARISQTQLPPPKAEEENASPSNKRPREGEDPRDRSRTNPDTDQKKPRPQDGKSTGDHTFLASTADGAHTVSFKSICLEARYTDEELQELMR
jgi:hypothetical protein